jgi:hypothetical protein
VSGGAVYRRLLLPAAPFTDESRGPLECVVPATVLCVPQAAVWGGGRGARPWELDARARASIARHSVVSGGDRSTLVRTFS